MKHRVFLCDLDDTVADTDTTLRAEMAAMQGPGDQPFVSFGDHPPYHAARLDVLFSRPGLWEQLRPLPLGMALVGDAESLGFKVHVLSKGPAGHPQAWAEKLVWARRHLPGALVAVVEDKVHFAGDVLMDDRPGNVSPWLDAHPHGRAILVGQPWNEGYVHERAVRVAAGDAAAFQAAVTMMTQVALREEDR